MCMYTHVCMHAHLVKAQDGLDALVQEAGLPEQASSIQRHQLLIEVYSEHV